MQSPKIDNSPRRQTCAKGAIESVESASCLSTGVAGADLSFRENYHAVQPGVRASVDFLCKENDVVRGAG